MFEATLRGEGGGEARGIEATHKTNLDTVAYPSNRVTLETTQTTRLAFRNKLLDVLGALLCPLAKNRLMILLFKALFRLQRSLVHEQKFLQLQERCDRMDKMLQIGW